MSASPSSMVGHGVMRVLQLGATFACRGRALHAVNGLDLEFRDDVLGIVGKPGCGKSTLARMLPGGGGVTRIRRRNRALAAWVEGSRRRQRGSSGGDVNDLPGEWFRQSLRRNHER